MAVEQRTQFESQDTLNAWLAGHHMRGQWVNAGRTEPAGPKPFGAPHLWKAATIREGLAAAAELVPVGEDDARRTTCLVHPSLTGAGLASSPTLLMCVQLVMPGEMALAHRHTATALRFVVEGEVEAYTVVDGEKCVMERGDLILTPNWAWHEHHNAGTRPVVWVDGLDAPLIRAFSAGFFEPFPSPSGVQTLTSEADSALRRPGEISPPGQSAPRLVYKWRHTLPALQTMDPADKSPFDGRCLEYQNAGGHTLRTLTCWVQMLDPGEATASHRHTYTHAYHAFEGSGITEVEGQEFAWQQGDCLVVPNWTWHRHRNPDREQPAILFSMNDIPLLEWMGVLREEPARE
ncbi:MAG TPA: cupin domain-containing protein [Chloroflexota bacterium]